MAEEFTQERTAPPFSAIQGLTLGDLQFASEQVFQRGWDAACAYLEREVDQRIAASQRETDDAAERARQNGYGEGQRHCRENLAEETRQGRHGAQWLVSKLKDIIADLPKNTADDRRADLDLALGYAKRAQADLDKLETS